MCLTLAVKPVGVKSRQVFTLKPLYSPLPKRHGQVQGNVVLVVADDTQELKLELEQSLRRRQNNVSSRLLRTPLGSSGVLCLTSMQSSS